MCKRHKLFAFFLAVSVVVAAPFGGLRAQTRPLDPASLPAHDLHQGLLVAVRADVNAAASKAVFGQHDLFDAGILGLDVYFRNDNDQPIRVDLSTVRLFISDPGDRSERPQRLDPLDDSDVSDAVLLKQKDPSVIRNPLPGAGPKARRDKNWQQYDAVVRSVSMAAGVLPPHATVHGYFYFDIDHRFDWLSNARLDISSLNFMTSKEGLLFFEVDLAPVAPR